VVLFKLVLGDAKSCVRTSFAGEQRREKKEETEREREK